MRAESMGFSGV